MHTGVFKIPAIVRLYQIQTPLRWSVWYGRDTYRCPGKAIGTGSKTRQKSGDSPFWARNQPGNLCYL